MCAIYGIIERAGTALDRAMLERATNILQHRGPDGAGFFCQGRIGLGHRRLSIIDLAGGDQPIYNEDRSICVVFNGEIYNYRELREQLVAKGHSFLSHSDTEVIVHGYEEWGVQCLDRFRGMFAFALWDGPKQQLFIARDRMGKKPLYYFHRDGRFIFASELKAILADPRVPRKLDLTGVDQYLSWKAVPGDVSILEGIEKLPPGQWLLWKDETLRTGAYWDVSFAPDERFESEQVCAEQLEKVLRDAVRLRLRSDVPIGVFLSGGLDSSSIVALACQESGSAVATYSVGFAEAEFNELPYAKAVADHFGTKHTEILVKDQSIDILPSLAYHLDEPFGDASAVPTYYVCREARKHVTVCLSGDGGDELFAGYSRYEQSLAAARRYDRIPQAVRRLAGRSLLSFYRPGWTGYGEIQRMMCPSAGARYQAMMSAFTLTERKTLLQGSRGGSTGAAELRYKPYFRSGGTAGILEGMQHMDQKNYLPDDVLVKVDRMSMQNSLEVRSPLLDQEVVRVANAAPAHLKLRNSGGKHLLRQIMAKHLPAAILTRGKQGFGLPVRDWFRGTLKNYAADLLLASDARSASFLNRQAVSNTINLHQQGHRDLSERIWALLMLEHWLRAYKI